MIVLWDFLRIFVSQIKQLELSMKKRILYCILFALSFCCRMTAASGVYDVREYGAKGDGTTLDHGAINKAIEAATMDGGHTYFHNSLIWAEGQQNVSITGHGMIDGEGLTKHDTEKAGNVQGGSIGTGDPISFWKM